MFIPRPKLDEAPADGAGGSSAPAQPTQEPSQPAPAQQPSQSQQQTPEGFVPKESLNAVTAERDRLKREAEERDREKAEAEGRWQELAQKNDDKAKSFESKFLATARRAAFVAAASGKASDPMAAYKLAIADGLLDDVKVSDDGEAEEKPIADAVDVTLKKYAFLKSGAGSFGGERGSTQSEPTDDPNRKITSRERLEAGIAASMGRTGSTRR